MRAEGILGVYGTTQWTLLRAEAQTIERTVTGMAAMKLAKSRKDTRMTTGQDQQVEAVWLGTAHALHVCVMMHGKGMMDGRTAASAHAPRFLSIRAVLQAAWEASGALQKLIHPAQQDEYFVGWVQGYGQCADEVSDKTPDMLDTWEDDGGASAVPWFDVNKRGGTGCEM